MLVGYALVRFLSTPSRGGRQDGEGHILNAAGISIHALTWRATLARVWRLSVVGISIHALTWRATQYYVTVSNSGYISIHALTWRATQGGGQSPYPPSYFYPRPHVEGDRMYLIGLARLRIFLSTPSRGGRRSSSRIKKLQLRISIHALTWRATCPLRCLLSLDADFYPRPHVEGDMVFDWFSWQRDGFLSTPSRGGRLVDIGWDEAYCHFYPRPHVEGDANPTKIAKDVRDFYPRPHVEGDRYLWFTDNVV